MNTTKITDAAARRHIAAAFASLSAAAWTHGWENRAARKACILAAGGTNFEIHPAAFARLVKAVVRHNAKVSADIAAAVAAGTV